MTRTFYPRVSRLSSAVVLSCLLCSVSALAQPVATQGGVETRDELERGVPDAAQRRGTARVSDRGAFVPEPCALDGSDVAVTITGVSYSRPGGGALAPEIAALLADEGVVPEGTQPVSVVCQIRDHANYALRRAGYVARVQVPVQTLESGQLRMEVVTARLVDIRIQGDAPPFRDAILARAEQLKSLDPFNERDAERILLLAGDIPGLDIQLSLSPAGSAPGDVVGDLIIAYRPYQLLANVQNYGSRQLGRETFYARGEFYGLTGLSDLTYIGGSSTADFEEQRVLQAGHVMGLGGGGATIGINGVYAWSRPDLDLLDLRSESYIANLEVAVPLKRTRRASIDGRIGFDLIEQRIRVGGGPNGSQPLNRDRLRVLYARLEGEWSQPRAGGGDDWSIRSALELRQGLDIFGATETGVDPSGYTQTRVDGKADAFVAQFEFEGVARIMPLFSIAALAEGQWSDGPLLNFEEYSIGNLGVGRGYDPGANSGDRAIAMRAELRAHVHDDARARVDLFAFIDNVHLWNRDPNATENNRSLTSWGGGIRALWRPHVFAELTYAKPLDLALDLPNAMRPPERVLFSLTFQFSPPAR